MWLSGVFSLFFGFSAAKKSNASAISKFLGLLVVLCVLPTIYALIKFFPDVYTFISGDKKAIRTLQMWKVSTKMFLFEGNSTLCIQGYPVGVIWYAFLMIATQIHFAETKFAWTLLKAWKKPSRKSQ